MSPLWRKHLRVGLAPDRVTALLFGRGRSAPVENKAVWPCLPASSDAHRWQAAVRILAEGLPRLAAQGAQVTVVLSNHFVRYAVVPWSIDVTAAAERQAMARIIFEKNFGLAAAGWALRISDESYGHSSLATALDAELPAALREACDGAGVGLASVQPFLMAAFNQYRSRLTARSFCLVVAEPGKAGILMAHQGHWHAARALALRDPDAHDLLPLARREILLAGLPQPPRIYMHVPVAIGASHSGADVEVLNLPRRVGLSPLGDADYRMVLSGLS